MVKQAMLAGGAGLQIRLAPGSPAYFDLAK